MTIHQIMPVRESADEEEIARVLQEISLEKSNELLALDLSDIHAPHHAQVAGHRFAQGDVVRPQVAREERRRLVGHRVRVERRCLHSWPPCTGLILRAAEPRAQKSPAWAGLSE